MTCYLWCEIEKQMPAFFGKKKCLLKTVNAEEMAVQFVFLVKSFVVLTLSQLSLFCFKELPLLCLHVSNYQEPPEEPSTFSWV